MHSQRAHVQSGVRMQARAMQRVKKPSCESKLQAGSEAGAELRHGDPWVMALHRHVAHMSITYMASAH